MNFDLTKIFELSKLLTNLELIYQSISSDILFNHYCFDMKIDKIACNVIFAMFQNMLRKVFCRNISIFSIYYYVNIK